MNQELNIVSCLFSDNQLRREVFHYLMMIVSKPVFLNFLGEPLVLACFLHAFQFLFSELGDKFGFESLKVIETLQDCFMLVLKVSERAASFNICLLILDVRSDPI